MAKPFGGKRPQDLRHTLRRFMDYLGRHKIMLGVVGLLAAGCAAFSAIVSARARVSTMLPLPPILQRE